MKAYTDIKQSKVLATILPIESADMYYALSEDKSKNMICFGKQQGFFDKTQVAWSLAALLNAVDFSTINLHYDNVRTDWVASATIHDSTKHCTKYESTRALNLLDACYKMVLKLNELNLL